jgi:phosphate starvation-inducible PhoH-like protein
MSGLMRSVELLRGIDGIGIIQLDESDVIRHKLVKKIIIAFEKHEAERAEKNERNDRDNRGDRYRNNG